MQAATFTRHRNAVQANASSMPGASRVETPFVRIWEDLPGFVGKLEKFAERASDDLECDGTFCGCSSMVEPQPSKLAMPVRSRSPAPRAAFVVTLLGTDCRENNAEISACSVRTRLGSFVQVARFQKRRESCCFANRPDLRPLGNAPAYFPGRAHPETKSLLVGRNSTVRPRRP